MSYPLITVEYVRVQITDTKGQDLTAASVELAFILGGSSEPGDADWHAAEWDGPAAPTRVAQILVGPDHLEFARGQYRVWYRFPDTPERPARPAGWVRFG